MNEVCDGRGIESEALLGDHGNKAGAGFEVGIVELSIALVALEVGGIGRGEKCTLVMIKPPRDFWRTGILEVDDGIFVAIEVRFVKERAGTMQEAGEDKGGVFADALAIKTGEESGGAGP